MTQKSLKITVPEQSVRLKWEGLSDTPFSAEEVFEIVMRYCDAQDHAKSYRHRAALKLKLLKMRVEQVELLAQKSGLTVEAYLEMEAATLSSEE